MIQYVSRHNAERQTVFPGAVAAEHPWRRTTAGTSGTARTAPRTAPRRPATARSARPTTLRWTLLKGRPGLAPIPERPGRNLNFATVNQAIVTPQTRVTISPRIDYSINASNTLIVRYQDTRVDLDKQGAGNFSLASQR